MERPINKLINQLRDDLSNVRGKIYDLKSSFGFNDKFEPIEGGLTCMISAMYYTQKEFEKLEDKWLSENKVSNPATP